jgi:hypothetical protein
MKEAERIRAVWVAGVVAHSPHGHSPSWDRLQPSSKAGWYAVAALIAADRARAEGLKDDLEGERASLCDLLNSAIRDTEGPHYEQVEPERMKPGVEALWFRCNRIRGERDALKARLATIERERDAWHERCSALHGDDTGHMHRCLRVDGAWSCHPGCAVAKLRTIERETVEKIKASGCPHACQAPCPFHRKMDGFLTPEAPAR